MVIQAAHQDGDRCRCRPYRVLDVFTHRDTRLIRSLATNIKSMLLQQGGLVVLALTDFQYWQYILPSTTHIKVDCGTPLSRGADGRGPVPTPSIAFICTGRGRCCDHAP